MAICMRVTARPLLIMVALLAAAATEAAAAQKSSGLPIPRYVSLKSDRVNLRKGPGTEFPIAWVYERAGLPVEVIKEYENWRQVRDSEGAEGWVLHSLLSGRRTVLILPWEIGKKAAAGAPKSQTAPIYASASTTGGVAAYAEAGTLASIVSCTGTWCEVSIDDQRGWIEQVKLWGVYKDEQVQ